MGERQLWAEPSWCEQLQLLASMYGTPHLPPAGLQSTADVQAACGMLERFLREVEEEQEQLQVQVRSFACMWWVGGALCRCVPCRACLGLRALAARMLCSALKV